MGMLIDEQETKPTKEEMTALIMRVTDSMTAKMTPEARRKVSRNPETRFKFAQVVALTLQSLKMWAFEDGGLIVNEENL